MIFVFLLALVVARHSRHPNLSEPTLPSRLAVIDVLSSRLRILARAAASPWHPRHLLVRTMREVMMEHAVKRTHAEQVTD